MSQHSNLENDETLGGRLRLLRPQELTAERQELYHYLLDSKIRWATAMSFCCQPSSFSFHARFRRSSRQSAFFGAPMPSIVSYLSSFCRWQ